MEVILATGFGHKIDLINGKTDELTKASEFVFEAMRKGNTEPMSCITMLVGTYSSDNVIINYISKLPILVECAKL